MFIYAFSYNYCYFFTKMTINMVNTCVIDDEGGQAHGNELQEFPHCVKLYCHGYIKLRKLKFRLHVTV